MANKQWQFLFASGFKAFFISPEVSEKVLAHTKANTDKVFEESLRDTAFVDLPGACLVDREYWMTELDGLRIEIPMTDVPVILESMRDGLNSKKFKDRGWFNVYGWRQCISLSENQYKGLIKLMEDDIHNILERCDVENAKFKAAIESIRGALLKGMQDRGVKAPDMTKPFNGEWN